MLGIKMGTELLNGHGPRCLRAEMVFSLLPAITVFLTASAVGQNQDPTLSL